jgi:hypothetical protein
VVDIETDDPEYLRFAGQVAQMVSTTGAELIKRGSCTCLSINAIFGVAVHQNHDILDLNRVGEISHKRIS